MTIRLLIQINATDGRRGGPDERLIVPTLCVGMPQWTLCVRCWDAERPGLHSHAERGSEQWEGLFADAGDGFGQQREARCVDTGDVRPARADHVHAVMLAQLFHLLR